MCVCVDLHFPSFQLLTCRTACGFCCIPNSSWPLPKYLLVSISSANSTYSSLSSFPLLWVGRFFKPWLCIFWFVSTCETKFWKRVGFPWKCWLSAWVLGDMELHIQQSCSLLPQSNKSLSLYRCVLNFALPTISLCLISPGKELHSQLPLLRILQWMSFQGGKVCGQITSCYETKQLQSRQPGFLAHWSGEGAAWFVTHGSGEEKRTGQVSAWALRFLRQQLVPALTDTQDVGAQPFILEHSTCDFLLCCKVATTAQGGSGQLSSGSREALDKRVGMKVQMYNLLWKVF